MTEKAYNIVADALITAIEDNAYDTLDCEVRLDYSGRGMLGKYCLAIVAPRHEVEIIKMSAFEEVLETLHDITNLKDYDENIEDILLAFKEALKKSKSDSMGTNVVVYMPDFSIPQEYKATFKQKITDRLAG